MATLKAVIFDLFETLVTEWGRPKYLSREVAADLCVDYQAFRQEWGALGRDRFLGKYAKVEDAYRRVLGNLGINQDEQLLIKIAQKRTQYKRKCFDVVESNIIDMLSALKAEGYKIGLISNCSPEEIGGLKDSALYSYFDTVVLSCDVGMAKPDIKIYEHCLSLLDESASDCCYIGDGGSNELQGAKEAGMMPLRALWFIKYFVENLDMNNEYSVFHKTDELIEYIIGVAKNVRH